MTAEGGFGDDRKQPWESDQCISSAVASNPSLETLKDIFKDKIDVEVIEIIWQDSLKNGNIALGHLMEMSPSEPVLPPPSPATTSGTSWSSLLSRECEKPFAVEQGARPKVAPDPEQPAIISIIHQRVKRERVVVLMRGVPGSGKSHLARQIRGSGVVLSTDDFFYDRHDQYMVYSCPFLLLLEKFNPRKLSEAHEWNRRRADREMKAGSNPIVIDNTNLEAWEMEPYVCLALRYSYGVDLVEPQTPWRENVGILTKKNTHCVPREKISEMLEKQKVPIHLDRVIDSCRRKMNLPPSPKSLPPAVFSSSVRVPERPDLCPEIPCASSPPAASIPAPSSDRLPNPLRESNDEMDPPSKMMSSDGMSPPTRSQYVLPAVRNGLIGAANRPSDSRPRPPSISVAIQTSTSDPNVGYLIPRSRSIQTSRLVADFASKPNPSKPSLDKGCNTEDVADELDSRKALLTLKSYFPTKETRALADVLEQCQGDLTWAINLLLDSGYECAEEVADDVQLEEEFSRPQSAVLVGELVDIAIVPARDDETNSCTSSEASSHQSSATPSASSEEVEAVRKHVESCFTLTDTISDQARRICGKDYSQFRASQLSKSRQNPMAVASPVHLSSPPATHPIENREAGSLPPTPFPVFRDAEEAEQVAELGAVGGFGVDLLQQVPATSLLPEEETVFAEDDGATVPMTLDPSFVRQLVALFGAPDLNAAGSSKVGHSEQPVSFDIPWSLAEQIYMHWCSSLLSQGGDRAEEQEDDAEENSVALQTIMDIEYAMKLSQEEKNAERRQVRESLSTKLSFQMLKENYANVDPLALDALFEQNDFNYAHTVTALNASLGTKPRINKPLAAVPASPRSRDDVRPKAMKNEPTLGAEQLRADAFLYDKLRREAQVKAQDNLKRGMASVAAYYASESRRYAELYKECNQKASLLIVEEKNANSDERTIDLHALHVKEALTLLESFIAENLKDGKTVIQVITGRGKNSLNGVPKIKPAVIAFLKQKHYEYQEENPGMLRVSLRRSAPRLA